MTPEQKEITKAIVIFLGGTVEIGYENKTSGYIDYTVKGKVVEEWRKMGLQTFGYQDSMLLDSCKFHSSWDWIMLVVPVLRKKMLNGIIPMIRNSEKIYQLSDALIKADITKAFLELPKVIEECNKLKENKIIR
jgi:hypothetical protein